MDTIAHGFMHRLQLSDRHNKNQPCDQITTNGNNGFETFSISKREQRIKIDFE